MAATRAEIAEALANAIASRQADLAMIERLGFYPDQLLREIEVMEEHRDVVLAEARELRDNMAVHMPTVQDWRDRRVDEIRRYAS